MHVFMLKLLQKLTKEPYSIDTTNRSTLKCLIIIRSVYIFSLEGIRSKILVLMVHEMLCFVATSTTSLKY